MDEIKVKSPGDTFVWKDIPFVVINVPAGANPCAKCDIWVGGFCIADENLPPCKRMRIAFKNIDEKKYKKLIKKKDENKAS